MPGANSAEKDRQTLLLRFFERKSFLEVATALGTNEDAATKRARRAVEKLRQLFIKRGVALSTTAIGGLLVANGVQAAPASLAASVSTLALIQGTASTASTATLIKGTLKLMAWTKFKTTAVALGVFLALGTATVTVTTVHSFGSGGSVRFLPGGSFIRLLSIDYGTRFSYKVQPMKLWERKVAAVLPSAMASRFDGWLGNGSSMSFTSTPG